MNFILPGFYEKFEINKKLITLYEIRPDIFIDNFNFGCFYGNIGFNLWSGGRIFNEFQYVTKETIEEIRDFYNSKNIPIRLTFTNPIIQEEHLEDGYCNLIMTLLNNSINEVIITSSLLEEYLRSNYPNFKYCSSTTKCITKPEDFKKELTKNYYQICLDYNLNHNFTFLDSLNEEEKYKCEFLCNAICPPGCPNRKEHYKLNGLFQITGGRNYIIDCGIKGNTLQQSVCKYTNNISPEEIQNIFIPKGFSHFKLEGRTLSDIELTLNLVRYCIKPQFWLETINILLN